MNETILSIRDLHVHFPGFLSKVHAINGCSLNLKHGELLGLVGESGCGKSLTSTACLGLLPQNALISGEIIYNDRNLLTASDQDLSTIRGKDIAMIFQNPMTALNPYFSIGQQMRDIIIAHHACSHDEAETRSLASLNKVHLPDPDIALNKYPHQFSGGQLQRIMIAIALSCEPKILIADEPTTALDVTIQAQIILLLRELVSSENLSVIFITHDFSVVASMCDRVAVMYAGKIVEQAEITQLFSDPQHPYTQGLLQSVPELGNQNRTLYAIKGGLPDMRKPPKGCAFFERCQSSSEQCQQQPPTEIWQQGRMVRCHHSTLVQPSKVETQLKEGEHDKHLCA
ncbi:ABC transporter ATP-binding protein [Vibrio sp. ZSDE26]|uniref:ABC-type dipeptide transporter n=1 Tax=Vibrio amylolyticus TaxID=2847292 RepID=A0A9X2BIK8_9VIBR|nr:ABC transporter ATP-binding protein [Vibrio amylolyticus]MCK6264245.1 ABC transporter ATP-binding protein [Vibrio amylolyticus]